MITYQQFLDEARRNSHLNPKVSINQRIYDHWENAKSIPSSTVKNSFVSFTEIDKLGINPKSKYDTPLGIYSYSSDFIIDTIGKNKSMKNLPFAGESPFANIFTVNTSKFNIIDLQMISSAEYIKIMKNFVKNELKMTDEEMEIFFSKKVKKKEALNKTEGGIFWYTTMKLAQLLAKESSSSRFNKVPVAWNAIFRNVNIGGVIDKGAGIIHRLEPAQAVFFDKSVITKVERHDNKWSDEIIDTNKEYGEKALEFLNSENFYQQFKEFKSKKDYASLAKLFVQASVNSQTKIHTKLFKEFSENEITKIQIEIVKNFKLRAAGTELTLTRFLKNTQISFTHDAMKFAIDYYAQNKQPGELKHILMILKLWNPQKEYFLSFIKANIDSIIEKYKNHPHFNEITTFVEYELKNKK